MTDTKWEPRRKPDGTPETEPHPEAALSSGPARVWIPLPGGGTASWEEDNSDAVLAALGLIFRAAADAPTMRQPLERAGLRFDGVPGDVPGGGVGRP